MLILIQCSLWRTMDIVEVLCTGSDAVMLVGIIAVRGTCTLEIVLLRYFWTDLEGLLTFQLQPSLPNASLKGSLTSGSSCSRVHEEQGWQCALEESFSAFTCGPLDHGHSVQRSDKSISKPLMGHHWCLH